MLQFPHLHLDNTHIVSTDEKFDEEKMPNKKKESIYKASKKKTKTKQNIVTRANLTIHGVLHCLLIGP